MVNYGRELRIGVDIRRKEKIEKTIVIMYLDTNIFLLFIFLDLIFLFF